MRAKELQKRFILRLDYEIQEQSENRKIDLVDLQYGLTDILNVTQSCGLFKQFTFLYLPSIRLCFWLDKMHSFVL